MADNGNGTKLDSMIPNPEILLTEVCCNNSNCECQNHGFL